MAEHVDVAVVGSGFGGLGAALALAESGARVTVFEALKYPGGCASTFSRRGHTFESGATLFSGFGPGQYFDTLIQKFALPVTFVSLDPAVDLRAPGVDLQIPHDRDAFIARMCALPGAPVDALTRFFEYQRDVADTLWQLFDDPTLLPPFGGTELLRHLRRTPRYTRLLGVVGTSVSSVAQRFGVWDFTPMRVFLDAVCQITIQTSASQAEAPFALATMDYYFRGTGHIQGGIGELAWAMVRAAQGLGATFHMADKVTSVRREGTGWLVTSRRREVHATTVIANMLPQDVMRLGVSPNRRLSSLARRVEDGWGACMLYFVLAPDGLPTQARHYELVGDAKAPFVEGNHVFCSLSGEDEARGADGARTMTCSTHVKISQLRTMSAEERAAFVERIQATMRATIAQRAPELLANVRFDMPGSPRTFQRFTLRSEGLVGGVPRTVGWHNYMDLFPRPFDRDFYLVGDSVFPGQSTLATAIGGDRVARKLVG